VSQPDRLTQILDAAYLCFTRHGVRRTTMDDIAREAGLSRPGVYQHVGNKEDVFRRLTERLLDAALTRSRAAAEQGQDVTARVTGILDAKLGLTLALWRDSPAHAAELLGVDSRLSADQIDAYDRAMRQLLVDALTNADPDVPADELADVLLAFTRGLEAARPGRTEPSLALRRGVTLLMAGLGQADQPGDEHGDQRDDQADHVGSCDDVGSGEGVGSGGPRPDAASGRGR
jgi:AcrR family transcriptional regulator